MIAIIDDDASTCQYIQRLLRSHGFASQTYTSAQAFLASGHLEEFRCLVLDVRMPGQSGLDLQDTLIVRGWRVPIIFITGYVDNAVRNRALQAGAVAVLEKSFDADSLVSLVRETVSGKKVNSAPLRLSTRKIP